MKPSPLSSSAATRPSVSSSSRRPGAEADDSERRRRGELERVARIDASTRQLSEVERPVDRGAERVDAERCEREPELEGARGARELKTEVGEVDDAVVDLCVAEIVGVDLERAAQRAAVADEQAAALVRLVEPLVRVERDRVGAARARRAARGRARVRTANPPYAASTCSQTFRSRQSGASSASGSTAPVLVAPPFATTKEREPARSLVGRDRRRERRGLEPQVVVDRQHAHLVRPEAEDARRSADRRVRLVGGVDDEVVAHRADARLARAGESRSGSRPSRR